VAAKPTEEANGNAWVDDSVVLSLTVITRLVRVTHDLDGQQESARHRR